MLTDLRIATHPHSDPKDTQPFIDELLAHKNKLEGSEKLESRPFDRVGLEKLRQALSTPHLNQSK